MSRNNDRLPPKFFERSKLKLENEHFVRMDAGSYRNASISNLEGESLRVANRYIENARELVTSGWGLFLWGKHSSGKTYTATAIGIEMMRMGYSVFKVRSGDLKDIYLNKDRMFDSEVTVFNWLRGCHVLIIDDPGTEYLGTSGFFESNLKQLLMDRTQARYAVTFMTSNINPTVERKGIPSLFEQKYGTGTAQVILEMMRPVEINGKNYRQIIQNRMEDIFS